MIKNRNSKFLQKFNSKNCLTNQRSRRKKEIKKHNKIYKSLKGKLRQK